MATITIKSSDVWYDARANTWKTGRIAPREDGLHGETQMSDDTLDQNLAKRLIFEGVHFLVEAVKDFRDKTEKSDSLPTSKDNISLSPSSQGGGGEVTDTPSNQGEGDEVTDTPSGQGEGGEATDTITINLSKTNSRCNITDAEASALGHEYVLAYVLSGWYRLVEPDRTNPWEQRKADARLRLQAALRYKTEPPQ